MLQGSTKMNLWNFLAVNFTRLTYTILGIIFLASGLMINFLQLLIFIFIKPFNKYIFRRLNYYLSYSLNSQIIFLLQYWGKVEVTLHSGKGNCERYFGKEHAFLLMNHSYEIDWMIGWILCDYCHVLGNVKAFAKKSIQYLPTMGYSWKLGGSIFLERNWEKDKTVFEDKLRDLMTYEDPFWLLLMPEGTRFTTEKHEASKAFAKQKGLPELRYHLTPRTKGFTATIPIIRKAIAAVYNINVGIQPGGVKPTLTNILLGKSINAEFYVERIPINEIPEGKAELENWLHSLFKRKDDLVHSFLTTGNWSTLSDAKEYKSYKLPRGILPPVNFACWTACVIVPLGYLMTGLIMNGSFIFLSTIAGIIGSFVYILDKLVEETKISKASSYGTQRKTLNPSSADANT